MLKLENLYTFMGNNFDYLLVIDDAEKVVHTSKLFARDSSPDGESLEGRKISDLINPSSLNTFRSAMAQARAGGRGISVFTPVDYDSISIPLKTGHTYLLDGEAYIFFSNKLTELGRREEWEKEERAKELSCLYNVAEFIEVSESIDEFFTKLPHILSRGMLYQEEAVVYSEYQGVEYGQKPAGNEYIAVQLIVGNEHKGEIRVGYLDDKHELLPEEQKMLDEIGRILHLALERKEFRARLTLKQGEEAEFNERLIELTKEVKTRTKELEEQRSNLDIVNSYLNRVEGNWEETKGRLETVFKAIPDQVVLIDKKRKVVMTNREDVVPGDYCFRSFFGREKPCDDCRLARILQDKTPVTLTMRNEDKYLQVHALPVFNQDHEVDGILEFYRDITLEKTYDQQLLQADKLASLGQLVSGIGHEINNPNQFIRGNVKIIKQSLEDILPIIDEYAEAHPDFQVARLKYDFFREHIMTLVDDMAHGSERIKGIVEGLRTFVRKDEGLLVDTVDINTLIEASTRLVHKEVHKYADIELDLTGDLPTFTGNAQKIEQVMINLIVNASEAMREDVKGLVTVRTRLEGNTIIVDVKDNGVGMNQQTIKQIFDPFFTTKRAKGGTGLGLAIAYRIIEEHGGNVSVQSKAGAGTTFTIRIPAGASKQPPKGTA